jgi:hypothetical protein
MWTTTHSCWPTPRALLASNPSGGTDYIEADLYDPGALVGIARTKLDFGAPVAMCPRWAESGKALNSLPSKKVSRHHHHNDCQAGAECYDYQQTFHPLMLANGMADVVSPAQRNFR